MPGTLRMPASFSTSSLVDVEDAIQRQQAIMRDQHDADSRFRDAERQRLDDERNLGWSSVTRRGAM